MASNGTTRRSALVLGASALALGCPRVMAQAKPRIRFSAAFTETDPRAEAYRNFAAALRDDIEFEPYLGNTLFRQGTELVALQRGNLELCNLAPQDISRQVAAWSLMTSAYLFRDAEHLRQVFEADVGRSFNRLARDRLGIHILTPVYFGSRHVNLRPEREIRTPADMAGIKLRMPPGEFWQFLGESIGANPTPVAFAEVYTALQSGAIDGQDNPLVASRTMKFHEVTTQFVLTGHVVGYDVMAMNAQVWDSLSAERKQRMQAAADRAIGDYVQRFSALEQDALAFFRAEGKRIYTPNLEAFRTHAQARYRDRYGRDWPEGALDTINRLT